MKNRNSKEQVQDKVLKFFTAYDASRDLNILILKKQFQLKRKENQKLKTCQAIDYSNKTEIENLFLDCMDYQKRDYVKVIGKPPKAKTETVQYGVQMAINGTIKQVNLNLSGASLRDLMVSDQPSLICIFEQIFGHNKPPTFETQHGSVEQMGQGNSKVIRMMSSKTSQNKSM